MAVDIVFIKDDDINGVPMKKGTERKVSQSIAKEKQDLGVAELKKVTTKKTKKEGDK